MCIQIGDTFSKIIDPAGYIAEKTAPKAFAPYSGLHGTLKAMRPQKPVLPQPASQKLLGE
jgi:hypothetical protein